MSEIKGDLSQLDTLAAEFRRQAQTAAALRGTIGARLGETVWAGQSAQAFRDRWSQDYDSMLRRLEEDLGELASYIAAKRDQLDIAGNR